MKLTIDKSACCKFYVLITGTRHIHLYFDEADVKDDLIMLRLHGLLIGLLFGKDVNDFKTEWSVYE